MVHIRLLEQPADYLRFIRTDDIPFIQNGKARVYGIDKRANEYVGAAVIEEAQEPDNGPGRVLVVRNLYLTEDCRTPKVYDALIKSLSIEAAGKDYTGIVMQNAYPDDPLYESWLEDKCIRLDDGNIIYEADVNFVYSHSIFKKPISGLAGTVIKISDLDRSERINLRAEWKGHFPKGLSPEYLPGRWRMDFSYAFMKDSEYRGFILASELSSEKLYIGAIYSDPGETFAPMALISVLGRNVILNSDYSKVMFAVATDEGRSLCERVLRGMHSIKKWEIHNYYLEV